MTDSPRRCVVYARQSLSRDESESLSIEFQQRECAAYIARQGWMLVGSFDDPDTKGWKRNRPGFDAMLDQVRHGTADTIVLYKLSRFARNLMMQEEVVTEIADAGAELVSITEPHITTSPLLRQVMGAVNENYRRDQSDWLKSTFAARARKGFHHGYAPIGYRIEDKHLVVDDATAAIVRNMWDWALEGHGTPEITHRANSRGWPTRNGKPWSQTTVLRILRNPAYAGHVQFRNEIVAREAHPAIITDGEFRQVQALIDLRSDQRRKADPSWAEGFVYHACGRRMYLSGWSVDDDHRSRFRCKGVWATDRINPERCKHRPATVFASIIERQFLDAIIELAGRLADTGEIARAIARTMGATERQRAQQRTRLDRRLVDLEQQRQRLLDLVLSNKVDTDLYGARDEALKAEIATVRSEIDTAPLMPTPTEISQHHAKLDKMLAVVETVAKGKPVSLVPMLTTLEARYVVGEESRLEIADRWRPYFQGY